MNTGKKEFVIPAEDSLMKKERSMTVPFESGEEFVLPDYMPKVQKVLRVEARALPPTRYMGASSAQMSGSVLHTLIYVGEEGEISATVLPSKYEFAVDLDEDGGVTDVFADVTVESLIYRMSGPRSINIRTKLSAAASVMCEEYIDVTEDTGDGVHKLYGDMDFVESRIFCSEEIVISENIDIGHSEEKLLWCGSSAAVSDVRVTDGGVKVRGEAVLKLLTEYGGKPRMYTKKIPFDEFADGDVSNGASAVAMAKIVSTEASKGQGNCVNAEIVLVVQVISDTPCKLSVVKDIFSESCKCDIAYRTVSAKKHILSRSGVYNVGASIPKITISETDFDVIDTSGEIHIDNVTFQSGKITVNGRCKMNSIYSKGEGEFSFGEYSLPINISIPCDIKEGVNSLVSASLLNSRVRSEGNNLVCDLDVAVAIRCFEESEEKVVSDVSFSKEPFDKMNKYPLCVVFASGESIWSVAKKYHVSPSSLVGVNSIDIAEKDFANVDAIKSVKVLMIENK